MAKRQTLRRELSLRNLFTLSFGTIIGVGWITVLGSWLSGAGAGGGLVMLLIGLCYAEVATMYPVSGGEVAYIFEMFGLEISFFAGWFLALNYIATTAFEAISVGWILSALFPGIEGPVIYSILGTDVHLVSLLIGLGIMAVITMINYRGAKSTARFQDVMTLALVLLAVVFFVAGIAWGDVSNMEPLFVEAPAGGGVLMGVLAVFATTPFWFAGFDTIPQAMGEKAEDASLRMLPKVMILSILFALLFYALVIIAATMALPRAELLALDLPAAGALEAAFGSPLMGKIVLIAGLCGLITTWNAIFFGASRVIFALGRAHMIPHQFSRVHKTFASPAAAVLFVGLIGGAMAFLGKTRSIRSSP